MIEKLKSSWSLRFVEIFNMNIERPKPIKAILWIVGVLILVTTFPFFEMYYSLQKWRGIDIFEKYIEVTEKNWRH